MKIEIPDWAQDGNILVLSNGELVCYKLHGKDEPIWEKVIRCNRCGSCCMGLYTGAPFDYDDEGNCSKLRLNGKEWECVAGGMKPFRCLRDPVDEDDCCITYKRQE